MSAALVAVLRTRPETVVADYARLMRLAKYDQALPRDGELLLKLNLSWTKYFPACSTEPWQLEGIVRTLLEDGYACERIRPVENKRRRVGPDIGVREGQNALELVGAAQKGFVHELPEPSLQAQSPPLHLHCTRVGEGDALGHNRGRAV